MYTEIKYLNLLSVRLERFKQRKDYLWNFRCVICGDSQKNKTKARGFVFLVKGTLLYKCHNCQYSVPLPKLFEVLDPELYRQFRLEKFKDENKKPKIDKRKVEKVIASSAPVFKSADLPDLVSIGSLNNSHPAREYLLNRKLPTESLYFTEKFKEWTNKVKPGTFEDTSIDEPRIIIPFIDEEGNVFGFQGRSIFDSGLRYITILLDEDKPKIFGLNTVDFNKRIYITEGPFDSLLVPNALAMAGADISKANFLLDKDVVFIYDNEPRNQQITNRISRHIHDGDSVVIWPTNLKEKDINDMILSGISVTQIIETHTFSGMMAKLKFTDWKK